jgi:hypothetical protein
VGHRERASLAAAHADEGGQTIVLVALLFVVLLAFAALSLDVGRFYAERRYLQNAVDSAALACARAYSQGGTVQSAWNAADNILQLFNLKGNPIGAAITYPGAGDQVSGYTATLSYENNVVGDQNLIGGIKPIAIPLGCRVAITVNVDTYFIKLVQPNLTSIGMVTKAYATSKGGFLPSVTYKYSNGPGPGDGSTSNFINWTMQGPPAGPGALGLDYQCTTTSDSGCTPASSANPGRDHVIFGEDAKAFNDPNFRGYIALDIRDFQSTDGASPPNLIHETYDGVANNADANTLKSFEAQWIGGGYPGPDICTVTTGSFDKCAEIATIEGASAGIFVSQYDQFFKVGDTLLLQLYDGTVKTVPDFTIAAPNIAFPKNATVPTTSIAYTMNSQFADSTSVISTEVWFDDGLITNGAGDPSGSNPFMTGAVAPGCTPNIPPAGGYTCGSIVQNPTPVHPLGGVYTQTWSGMTAVNAVKGIYLAFLRGNATAPYNTRQHEAIVTLTVDGQTHDFNLGSSGANVNVATTGTQADFPIQIRDGSGSSSWNGGANSIKLTWERCPSIIDPTTGLPTAVLTCKINGNLATTFVTTDVGSGSTVQATFNVDTTAATLNTAYTGWIRAYGLDGSHAPVNHLYQVIVDVGVTSAGGVQTYVDVLGFAAFKVTNITSNDVYGQAVSPLVLDPNDPLLAIGKKIRLVPWETP